MFTRHRRYNFFYKSLRHDVLKRTNGAQKRTFFVHEPNHKSSTNQQFTSIRPSTLLSQYHENEEIESFTQLVTEEVPDVDVRVSKDLHLLETCVRKTLTYAKHSKINSQKALKLFLAFGDLSALSTPSPASAYLESLNHLKEKQEMVDDFELNETSNLYRARRTDIFADHHSATQTSIFHSQQHYSELTDYQRKQLITNDVRQALLLLLPLIDLCDLSSDLISRLSESFEYLPRSNNSHELVRQFWNTMLNRIFVDNNLDVSNKDLLKFLRHQKDTGEVSLALLDLLTERITNKFELCDERCISEACDLFGTLRYRDSKWIMALGRQLPYVLHEWHYSSIISVAEMLVSLDMTKKEMAERDQELVERLSQELWRWIPRMQYNFPSRALRALVFLEVYNKKSVDDLIKRIPNSLQLQGLHTFTLLAESFIAYSKTNSKRRRLFEYLVPMLALRMSECVSAQLIVDLLWSARIAKYFSASFYGAALALVDVKRGTSTCFCEFHLNHIILIARECVLVGYQPPHLLSLCLRNSKNHLHNCTPTALASLLYVLGAITSYQPRDDFATIFWKHKEATQLEITEHKVNLEDPQFVELVDGISYLLSTPDVITIGADICAGSRHDHRWRYLFQIEYQEAELETDRRDQMKLRKEKDVNEFRHIENVHIMDKGMHENIQNKCKVEVEMTDLGTINKSHYVTHPCAIYNQDKEREYFLNRWMDVPKWDTSGSSLSPYAPQNESPPSTLRMRLKKSGLHYLDATDVMLILRSLCEFKMNPFKTNRINNALENLLDDIEKWLIKYGHLIDSSQVQTFVCCLSELNAKRKSTKAILENIIERTHKTIADFDIPLLLFASYHLLGYQSNSLHILMESFRGLNGTITPLEAHLAQLIVASIRQDIHEEVTSSNSISDSKCPDGVFEFCEWVEKSDEWKEHRESSFNQQQMEALARGCSLMDRHNIYYQKCFKEGPILIDIAVPSEMALDALIASRTRTKKQLKTEVLTMLKLDNTNQPSSRTALFIIPQHNRDKFLRRAGWRIGSLKV